jgi:hypothetical protein
MVMRTRLSAPDYSDTGPARQLCRSRALNNASLNSLFESQAMKVIIWIIVGIFLIGLAVVLGLGKLIF